MCDVSKNPRCSERAGQIGDGGQSKSSKNYNNNNDLRYDQGADLNEKCFFLF